LQSKHNPICCVAQVKLATSTHFMADAGIRSEENIFKKNKVNNIRKIFRTLMFQQLLISLLAEHVSFA